MKVTLPDGSVKELDDGATGADLAASIGPGLARAALAIRVVNNGPDRHDGSAYDEGRIHDLDAPLQDGDRVEIVTANADDVDSVQLIRHDTAHVLAAALLFTSILAPLALREVRTMPGALASSDP